MVFVFVIYLFRMNPTPTLFDYTIEDGAFSIFKFPKISKPETYGNPEF